MLFDCNVYLGHYPFRDTTCKTIEALLQRLSEKGIDKAVVSSMPAVFYRDAQQGNQELHEAVAGYEKQILPAAVLNPLYPGFVRDANECFDDWGFRALKLFPCQHGYRLCEEPGIMALSYAAKKGVPVLLPVCIEDIRQRHPMDATRTVSPEEVLGAAKQVPDATLILLNGRISPFVDAVKNTSDAHARIFYDFAREDDLPALVKTVGAQNLVFATGMPLQLSEPQLLKLDMLCEEEQTAIAGGNAEKLF